MESESQGWGFDHQVASSSFNDSNNNTPSEMNLGPWASITAQHSTPSFGQQPRTPLAQSSYVALPHSTESIGLSLSNKILEQDDSDDDDGRQQSTVQETSLVSVAERKSERQESSSGAGGGHHMTQGAAEGSRFLDPQYLEFLSVKNDLLGDYSPEDIRRYGIVPLIPPARWVRSEREREL
jgi:hypothetical protein